MLRTLFLSIALLGCLDPVRETNLGMNTGGGSAGSGGGSAGGTAGGSAGGTAGGSAGGAAGAGGGNTLTPLTCVVGSWCWQSPVPQGQPLNAVFAVSETEVWAVGDRGASQRLKNGTWTAFTPVTDYSLHSIWGPGPNDLWAVGRKATGLSTTAYQVLHFDGTGWSVVPHGTLPNVIDLTGSAGEVWLLTGANTTTVPSQLSRWNGSAFVAAPALPQGTEPQSVCVRSASEVWATVSESGSFPTALYRYDGSTWSLSHRFGASSSQRFISRVGCPADGVALAQMLTFDTGDHSLFKVTNGQVDTSGTAFDELFRTPHGEVLGSRGYSVSRWSASGFQNVFSLSAGESVYSIDVDFLGSTGWLANGKPTVSSWNGSTFTRLTPQLVGLKAFITRPDVNPTDPTAAFGSGGWATRSGTTWSFRASPTVPGGDALRVEEAYSLPGGDAWLAGNGIARYDTHSGSVIVETSVTAPGGGFSALDGSDPSNVWAVGDQHAVLRFDGASWAAPSVPVPTVVNGNTYDRLTFTAVDVRGPNDVVLLGNDPAGGAFISVFFAWNGSAWSTRWQFGNTISVFDRDSQGNEYVVDGSEVKKRAPGATAWTSLGGFTGYVVRLRAYGVDEVELVTGTTEDGLQLFSWDSDQLKFTPDGARLAFSGAWDIVPGAPTTGGRSTYWALGTEGAVLRWEPAP